MAGTVAISVAVVSAPSSAQDLPSAPSLPVPTVSAQTPSQTVDQVTSTVQDTVDSTVGTVQDTVTTTQDTVQQVAPAAPTVSPPPAPTAPAVKVPSVPKAPSVPSVSKPSAPTSVARPNSSLPAGSVPTGSGTTSGSAGTPASGETSGGSAGSGTSYSAYRASTSSGRSPAVRTRPGATRKSAAQVRDERRTREIRRLVTRNASCLASLGTVEQRILVQRAGLLDGQAQTREAVARSVDLRISRVVRIERRAVTALRRAAASGCDGGGTVSVEVMGLASAARSTLMIASGGADGVATGSSSDGELLASAGGADAAEQAGGADDSSGSRAWRDGEGSGPREVVQQAAQRAVRPWTVQADEPKVALGIALLLVGIAGAALIVIGVRRDQRA